MTILTVDDCIEAMPKALLESDDETIRNEIADYFIDGYNTLRKADAIVFCTPDQRYIGIKCREAPATNLDGRNL